MHMEAACALGGIAALVAAQQIMAGLHDVVLVVGAEQQKTMSPADGADVLGAAGDWATEKPKYGQYVFPKLFGDIAARYAKRYELTERQLASVAAKNHAARADEPMCPDARRAVRDDGGGVRRSRRRTRASPRR